MTLTDNAVPAHVPDMDEQQRVMLQQAASELLFGRQVTIADNAFENTSRLLIERVETRDQRGLPIEGRRTDQAMVFSLLLDGDLCWLKREESNTSVALPDLTCQPLG